MPQIRTSHATALLAALLLAACETSGVIGGAPADDVQPDPPLPPPPFQAADSALLRLTQEQYRNTVTDVFGEHVVVAGGLENDNRVSHSYAVGAAFGGVSARGTEQYEAMAVTVAAQVLSTGPERDALMPCTPSGTTDATCARAFLSEYGQRLWRRALTEEELGPLVAISGTAATTLNDFYDGLEFGMVGLLTSPNFIYRVELGEPNPAAGSSEEEAALRFSSMEMASRLSYFLWNSTPDDTLLAAAEAGELVDDAALEAQVRRMVEDPRAREGVRAFFTELFELDRLSKLVKDPEVFVHIDGDVGPSAREETLLTLENNIFEEEGDYRQVFTTRTTFLNRKMASIYSVPTPTRDGFGPYTFPDDAPRAGILTQASFLALHSHATATSATARGKFIRVNILCGEIPPPPADVDTSIPEPSVTATTLRERLAEHRENPVCASCHSVMDPIGLGFENFDALGRFRRLEAGAIIDASSDLDGVPFADAVALGSLIANHPDVPLCLARNVYKYATGHVPEEGEQIQIEELTEAFAASGFRVKELLVAVALSEGFRTSRGQRVAVVMEVN
ncbi:MAG: DUF1592 domain-containing protein [Sandaracinaceae bacterium]|jgi:hypothetical protein|nr:DUF1592 domain-containing protein [Sandaracinaceae bacterium]